MVPTYSIVSFLSYYFYTHAIYFEVIYQCYEAVAIASFFALLCSYIAPELRAQKEYFRQIQPKGWVWPMTWVKRCCGGEKGIARTPRSGLTWFNVSRKVVSNMDVGRDLRELDHLVWSLPILFRASLHDVSSAHRPILWPLL